MSTRNLGNVRPLVKGPTPPTNTDLLWRDTSLSPSTLKAYDDALNIWVPVPTSAGEVNSGENTLSSLAPDQVSVFKEKTGLNLVFKVLEIGDNMSFVEDDDKIRLNIDTAGLGESNTASNVGSGSNIFKQKNGIDLEFNSLISISSAIDVALNSLSNNIEFELLPSNINLADLGNKDYTHLTNKPTIPTLTSQLTNDSSFVPDAPGDGGLYGRGLDPGGSGLNIWQEIQLDLIDTDAIHVNVADEFTKTPYSDTPSRNDKILLERETSGAKNYTKIDDVISSVYIFKADVELIIGTGNLSVAEAATAIADLPKNLNGYSLTVKGALETINVDSNISFEKFHNGEIIIESVSNSINPSTVFNFTAGTFIFDRCSAFINMRGLALHYLANASNVNHYAFAINGCPFFSIAKTTILQTLNGSAPNSAMILLKNSILAMSENKLNRSHTANDNALIKAIEGFDTQGASFAYLYNNGFNAGEKIAYLYSGKLFAYTVNTDYANLLTSNSVIASLNQSTPEIKNVGVGTPLFQRTTNNQHLFRTVNSSDNTISHEISGDNNEIRLDVMPGNIDVDTFRQMPLLSTATTGQVLGINPAGNAIIWVDNAGGGGVVIEIIEGVNITVNNADPARPVISATDTQVNLGLGTISTTTLQITSSTGDPVTIPAATASEAGMMSASDKAKSDLIAVTAGINLDTIKSDVATNTAKVSFPEVATAGKKFGRKISSWDEIKEMIFKQDAATIKAVTWHEDTDFIIDVSTGILYKFDPSSTATDNGVSILQPDDITGGNPGRWLKENQIGLEKNFTYVPKNNTNDNDVLESGVLYKADPTDGSFTLDLPASPTVKDKISVLFIGAATNAVTIDGNGHNINSASNWVTTDDANLNLYQFYFDVTADEWKVLSLSQAGLLARKNLSQAISNLGTYNIRFDQSVNMKLDVADLSDTISVGVANLTDREVNNGLIIDNSVNTHDLIVVLDDQSGTITFSGALNEFPGTFPQMNVGAGKKWRLEFYLTSNTSAEIEFIELEDFN